MTQSMHVGSKFQGLAGSAIAGARAHSPRLWRGGQRPDPGGTPSAPAWFFAFFAAGLVLRAGLNANLLNLFLPYSSAGGSAILKIHPGSYLLLFTGMVALPTVLAGTPMRRNPLAIATVLLIVVVVLVGASMIFGHDNGSMGYLVDTILIAPMSLIAMARLSIGQRIMAGRFILGLLFANGVISVPEFLVQRRLLPYPFDEAVFRPTGLFSHPLEEGLICVAALPYLFLVNWPEMTRWVLLITIAITVSISQARIATLVAACIIPLGLGYLLHQHHRAGRISGAALFVLATTMMLGLPLLVMAGWELGIFERLSLGLADPSAYSRIDVYDIFRYFSWNDILFGIGLDRAYFYAKHGLGLDTIESPIVMAIAQFGAIDAAIVLGTVLFFFLSLSAGAPALTKLGAIAFCITAASNNAFTSKGPAMVTAAVLLFAGATATRAREMREERWGRHSSRRPLRGRGGRTRRALG
jgi:hypothetical protein